MTDMLEKICQKQGLPTPEAQPAPSDSPPCKPIPSKAKPPVVGIEAVIAKCGHVVMMERFEEKKDRYRDQRRAKITDRPCKDCRQAAQPQPKPKKPKAPPTDQRLPDGSEFLNVIWLAGTWTGGLRIGPAHGDGPTFRDSAGGVFKLLGKLDTQYRRWLSDQTRVPSEAV